MSVAGQPADARPRLGGLAFLGLEVVVEDPPVDGVLVARVDAVLTGPRVSVHRLGDIPDDGGQDPEGPRCAALVAGVEAALHPVEPHLGRLIGTAVRLAPFVVDMPPRSAGMVEPVLAIGIIGCAQGYARADPLGLLSERLEGLIEDPVVRAIGVTALSAVAPREAGAGTGGSMDVAKQAATTNEVRRFTISTLDRRASATRGTSSIGT